MPLLTIYSIGPKSRAASPKSPIKMYLSIIYNYRLAVQREKLFTHLEFLFGINKRYIGTDISLI